MKASGVHGILVVDKPAGITSRDVVDRVSGWLPAGTRLGHAGTLDPLATGVLVVCAGRATRLIEYIQQMDKIYEAELRLGARSDTDDADGQVQAVAVSEPPDREKVVAGLRDFVGTIEQAPPRYSAARVSGRRAYDLARAGRQFVLVARRVVIHDIQLLRYRYPELTLEIRCSKGTYIRSLARDLGERLGCGALVQTLRRTRIGQLGLEQAVTLDADQASARSRLLPLSAAVTQLPRVTLVAQQLERLRQGQKVPVQDALHGAGLQPAGPEGRLQTCPTRQSDVAIVDQAGKLLAIAVMDADGNLRPTKVLMG